MKSVKKNAEAALHEALAKVDALIANANGEPASCRVFDPLPPATEFTDEQRRAVRLYVETWIRGPLALAIDSIGGDRDWRTEADLNDIAEGRISTLREGRAYINEQGGTA